MTRPTAAEFLKVARSQLGYVEGNNNDTKFGKWYGMNHQPWCDMFVSWCGAQSGGGDIIGKFASTVVHANWFKKAERWGKSPKVGSIVFFDFPNDGVDRISHVGIVEAVRSDGRITTIEGNTSSGESGSQANGGGVYRRNRAVSSVVGYGYPNYASAGSSQSLNSSTPEWPGRYIQLDDPLMRGDDVKSWQAQMKKRGWTIEVDGIFGKQSRDVLIQFQREKGLDDDGVLGPQSWKAAFEAKIT
jgi:peptidoglycan hydrolase-like protein with peptidoglycan-binding domain